MNSEGIAMNRLLLLLFVFMLQGCAVGVYAMYPQDMPAVSNPGMEKVSPRQYGGSHRYTTLFRESGITSCSQLLSVWGKPDNYFDKGSEAILEYKYGVVWAGLGVAVGFPLRIPLGIPVGQKKVTVACKQDSIVRSTHTLTVMGGPGCYWFLRGFCGIGESPL
jgi:hypothetical protein